MGPAGHPLSHHPCTDEGRAMQSWKALPLCPVATLLCSSLLLPAAAVIWLLFLDEKRPLKYRTRSPFPSHTATAVLCSCAVVLSNSSFAEALPAGAKCLWGRRASGDTQPSARARASAAGVPCSRPTTKPIQGSIVLLARGLGLASSHAAAVSEQASLHCTSPTPPPPAVLQHVPSASCHAKALLATPQ